MCLQLIERFSVCMCISHAHAVQPCAAACTRGHAIRQKLILVGFLCPQHSPNGGKEPVREFRDGVVGCSYQSLPRNPADQAMEPQEPGQVNPTGKNLNKAVTTKLDDNRKRHSKTLVASQLVEHTLPYTGSTQQQWDHFRPKLWQLWLAFGSDYGKIDELMQRKYSFSAR